MSAISSNENIFKYQDIGMKRELERKNLKFSYDEFLYGGMAASHENYQSLELCDASRKTTPAHFLVGAAEADFHAPDNKQGGFFESSSQLIEVQSLCQESSASIFPAATSGEVVFNYDSTEEPGSIVTDRRKDIVYTNCDKDAPDKTSVTVITKQLNTSIWIRDFGGTLSKSEILTIYSSIKKSIRNIFGVSIRLMINAVANK